MPRNRVKLLLSKGFTSIADVPQKSMNFRKDTSKYESNGFVLTSKCLDFAKFQNRSAVCARRQALRAPIAELGIPDTNRYGIASYLGKRESTTTTSARTSGSRSRITRGIG
jgi:hypothetical protein